MNDLLYQKASRDTTDVIYKLTFNGKATLLHLPVSEVWFLNTHSKLMVGQLVVNAIFPQHILACMSGLGSYSFSFFFSFYQCLYLEIWIVMVASLQGSTGWGRKWVVKLYWQPNCCQDMKAFDISIKYIFIHNPKIQCTNIKS